MCGIVGLLVKKPAMREQLGALMLPMLVGMGERGPDSAGLAVYGSETAGAERKFSLYADVAASEWGELVRSCEVDLEVEARATVIHNHCTLLAAATPARFKIWLKDRWPGVHLLSAGRAMEVYKDIGHPAEVAERYRFSGLSGSHVIGHTRMATESAVTPDRAHPFTAGEDFCLVHNGSLSNPYQVRRKLEPLGIQFDTDNDTEAACRFLEWRLRDGEDLESALHRAFVDLDGFFTFLMGTRDEMALVRDPYSCKPAVVAETDEYVAVSSEFRGLAKLPNIKNATLFEPMPEELYIWKA